MHENSNEGQKRKNPALYAAVLAAISAGADNASANVSLSEYISDLKPSHPESVLADSKMMRAIIDRGPAAFWMGVKNGKYYDKELSIDTVTYAAKKSPRIFFEWGLYRLPADIRTHKLVESVALASPQNFWNVYLWGGDNALNKFVPKDTIISVAKKDPIVAVEFLHSFYDKTKTVPVVSHDVLEGVLLWRDEFLQSPSEYFYISLLRVLNKLHILSDSERGRVIDGLTAKDYYRLITVAPDEIYPSSFERFLLPRLLPEIKKVGLANFLMRVDHASKYLPHFLELSAQFNSLGILFKDENTEGVDYIASELFDSIRGDKRERNAISSLTFMVHIANTVHNHGVLSALENALISNYKSRNNPDDKKAFSVLAAVYAATVDTENKAFLNEFSEQYNVADLRTISKESLFSRGKDGTFVHNQRWYFFSDPDGEASHRHAVGVLRLRNWREDNHGDYSVWTKSYSDNGEKRVIRIYMNDPGTNQAEDGNNAIDVALVDKIVHTVVQRGHVYHIKKVYNSVKKNGYMDQAITVLAACGGNTKIVDMQNLPYEHGLPHMITTSKTGKMGVNDYLLPRMSEWILSHGSMDWERFWTKINMKKIDPNYIPPYENLASVFMHTYTQNQKGEALFSITSGSVN